ncbi:carboxymuconolactone decarboxylase family protein [Aggregatibacter actinomycetemcomitans]|uniref:carboxymuconolactone decarboxylase family protein n=1 Tax=Aggregatibacter actinomycetemcomitans TaxID=714 RepID=UPI00197BD1DB|nr:carboxymuconolactone decarboxylase family protein [Aggregatibacter actinomycetemcomitans]MBN6080528.1 carboxymuconolactone decarboxylase family protein [Aggregatibacter actinomycetemcomitans]
MELTQRQQALAAIGAFTATGNQAELKTTLNHALDEGLTVTEAKDAMVQLYAYTGFPRSLNALFTLAKTVKERQEKGLKTEQGRTATALPKGMNMLEVGTKTQTDLVGQAVDLSALSPDIDRYLKTHLFGDIFASDLLNWQEREIITIGALNQLNVPSQLNAHIGIGKKHGLTDAQIQEIQQIGVQKVSEPSQFPLGKSNDTYAQYFSGQSYLAPLSTEQVGVYNITFEPTVRNNWHIHHATKGGGQILVVTAGRGYYQEWSKPARELKAGDVVNIPTNVKHWHGAAKDSWFQHLAIEVPGEGISNEWLEPVSDEEYSKLK